ncbi:hypothetical protein BD626DRAFT_494951 [Schizophyllum amplum]|uniref:Secreted protein n=1 Tax=Schizophyllum amplum TaxID=97359 RepID=A0A550CFU9_9AGAR|nr:hypothetical protein BD626DRAFT_494951 [Auriculariopsis ampla]
MQCRSTAVLNLLQCLRVLLTQVQERVRREYWRAAGVRPSTSHIIASGTASPSFKPCFDQVVAGRWQLQDQLTQNAGFTPSTAFSENLVQSNFFFCCVQN